jgi:hypothetical protein
MGRYDPPLGAFGREIDRMLLHRLAEASVRFLLTRIAQRVEEAAQERRAPAPAAGTGAD